LIQPSFISQNHEHLVAGYAQTEYQGFEYNGESDLDLQYGMTLVTGSQPVTLYQTGDMVEGKDMMIDNISSM